MFEIKLLMEPDLPIAFRLLKSAHLKARFYLSGFLFELDKFKVTYFK